MWEVTADELRTASRSVLRRVESGESATVIVDGRPAAVLAPIGRRPRWMGRDLFAATVLAPRAEDGLIDDLDGVAEETTGEPPLL